MNTSILTFEDVMAFDKRNAEVYSDILKLHKGKGLIPFLGAGISVSAGFMTWDGFLKHEYYEFMNGRIQPMDPLDAASELFNVLGAASFRKDIVKSFGGEYSDADWNNIMSRIQSEAAALLPKLFNDIIITTNFDRLLEHLYPAAIISHPGHNGQLNLAIQVGASTIFKLHGCVSEPDEIIFTRESYMKAYPRTGRKTSVVRALDKIFTSQTILFLGCSLKDDDTIKHWSRIISKPEGKSIEHFAIINCTSDCCQKKRRDLGNMNIRPILYDSGNDNRNHNAVRVILEHLSLDLNIESHKTRTSNIDSFNKQANELFDFVNKTTDNKLNIVVNNIKGDLLSNNATKTDWGSGNTIHNLTINHNN